MIKSSIVEKTLRILCKILKSLTSHTSCRDHHFKATHFNSSSITYRNNRFYYAFANYCDQLAISNQRHIETFKDTDELKLGCVFPHSSNHSNFSFRRSGTFKRSGLNCFFGVNTPGRRVWFLVPGAGQLTVGAA